MQVRRFGSELKVKLSGGHPGVHGVPIQMDRSAMPAERLEDFARRVNGFPLLLSSGTQVEAMYFDAHASIDEHMADHPILFLVISGRGTVRIGGPTGECRVLASGDAVLWPAETEHTVWTDDDTLSAIVINVPPETL